IFYFIICISLYFVWRSGKFSQAPGFIFGLGFALIFLQRFLVEFLKENQVPFEDALTLNMGQILSIPLVLGGVLLMIWSVRRRAAGAP
ncbi:MAG TPA: prolipoprotein diacylglyceryl transferase family protein, partial [Cyclobacteriaceae bacterium]